MLIDDVVNDKSLKSVQKREHLAEMLMSGELSVKVIDGEVGLTDKGIGLVLEAMEQVSRTNPAIVKSDWLGFAEGFVGHENNTLKRESSRIVGNLASVFGEGLSSVIPKLLKNTENDSTVVRWGSAYALAKIIALPKYATSELFDTVANICDVEQDSGIKSQYLPALRKAGKLRK